MLEPDPSPSRRLALTRIAGAAALLLGAGRAAGAAGELTIAHAQGRTMLPAAPRRIATFDLATLDILQSLGIEPVGVPAAAFPPYLAGYGGQQYAKIGTLFEPDHAALRAVRPDLIVVASRSAGKYAELSEIAPTIDLSTSTNGFIGSVAYNAQLLGRLCGRQAQAAARVERLLADVRSLQARGARAGRGLLLFAVGNGLTPQPPQTRFGVLYEFAGIAPAVTAADLPPPQPRPPQSAAPAAGSADAAAADQARRQQAARQAERLDALLARDVDWLFVLDRPSATGGEAVAPGLLAANAAITRTTAWKKGQVIALDAAGWYLVGGGLTQLAQSTAQIAAAFDRRP